jgi:hypothetical protein
MCFVCGVPKATNTHSVYAILIAFPLQQWLHERASMLCYASIACLAKVTVFPPMKEDSNLRRRPKNNMSAKKKIFYY